MSTHPQIIQPRRRYDSNFRQDAVDRVLRTGKPCSVVARELGVKPNLLARWRRHQLASADQRVEKTETLKPSELAEQLRLARQEIDDLRQQRDILKKALSIFSQTSPNGGR